MKFLLSDEHAQLETSLRQFFSSEFPTTSLRKYLAERRGENEREELKQKWKRFSELGALLGGVSEEKGGLGLGFLSYVVLIREAAKVLAPLPILETLCFGILPFSRIGNEILDKLLSGEEIATGTISGNIIPEAKLSTLIVGEHGAQFSIDRFSVAKGSHLDTHSGAEVVRDLTPLSLIDLQGSSLSGALSESDRRILQLERLLLLAAEMSGAARAVEEMTHQHVVTRKQFGVPIGSFQAIQHKLADVRVALDGGDSLLNFAAWTRDNDTGQFEEAALGAFVFISGESRQAIESCLQAQGGIAFTYEYDLHLYLRRVLSASNWFFPSRKAAKELAERYISAA